ncbi:uncharacterized protein Bfra_008313 [Botrytis fragariae]|uniref:Uncharacterized protein n=1 Tax=Botrytis fragariae TaxID=1964551 RepID=A0A8H6ASZ4_9HELO|nr:uncharacterized protein Bfra_008313 [Botrytis fragariae]KAF5873036.1 hypothetical protein Bfra_008313 [Botrytis fragariae]
MSPDGSVTLEPIREKDREQKKMEIKMAGIKVFRFINVEPSLLGLYILGSPHRVELTCLYPSLIALHNSTHEKEKEEKIRNGCLRIYLGQRVPLSSWTDRHTNQTARQPDSAVEVQKSSNMVPFDLGQKDRPRNGVSRRNSRTECTTCMISLGVDIHGGVHRTSLGLLENLMLLLIYDLALYRLPVQLS